MKQLVSIDDSTKKGQLLIELLKEFKGSKVVQFLSSDDLEALEDEILLSSMQTGRESGVADTESVYKKLDLK